MATTSSARRTRGEREWLGQWNNAVTSYFLLVGATGLLTVIGLVMVLSSSAVTSIADGDSPYRDFLTQAQYALMGVPVMLVATRVPVRWYKRLALPALLVAVALLLLVIFLGEIRNGQQNWLVLGPVSFQPSELAKLALALWLGTVLGRKQALLGSWSHAIMPAVPGAVVVLGLVLAGGDLGTAIVIGLLVAGAFIVAGVPAGLLGLGAVAAAAVGYAFVALQESRDRLDRILATYGADCDASSECYQSLHGLFGLGTGGLWGVGLGASREKWSYLPEAHNDFIYAVIGEELGLLGTLLVLGLFAVLGLATSRIVRRHEDPFVKVTTAAVACWIVGQGLVNIGVVIGLLPVIGVPLPLVSAGGSALITTMGALGMLISFARTEPGASEALAARGSVIRRSLAVLGTATRRRR
ncbi:putative lipid II flippase FtsW [Myceligenerans pegani]|uniref:Probable peptidoglycan glycosyltransferase FtsW n=1 Tax=Myceligenerans pegani TaxID=2776917 RepID=A0ABR9MYI7_9MICO|nr:putative lipid II flippase FtsW [Myceligenerans sp. TRM 65318]MBE1876450.1 putative lipid II flippase FtsW [Myceligenerans sp. TRM 65318]MBE3018721.1 putative lipid II flippase FtsW [Myceligenerans sp. TRM 65318]